jgi:hypothetical protein
MSDESDQSIPNLLGEIEARLVDEAKAKIARELADLSRLASAYPEAIKAFASQLGLTEAKAAPTPGASATNPNTFATMGELIDQYLTASSSPFHALKPATRQHYTTLLKLIEREHGPTKLAEVDANTLDNWYAKWREGGKLAVSYSKTVMLRNLFSFGITSIRDENCARLFGLLGKMQIELPKSRSEHLTREQANMIRAIAREKGRPSIALAQAFQSDLGLLQKDVIGEWVSLKELGMSVILSKGMKWLRGIQWDEIDENLILSHAGDGKVVPMDLKKAPMVMEELTFVKAKNGGLLPSKGPVIVSEYDELPWDAVEFRRWWRILADACGISKKVRNTDSRVKARNATSEGKDVNARGSFLE